MGEGGPVLIMFFHFILLVHAGTLKPTYICLIHLFNKEVFRDRNTQDAWMPPTQITRWFLAVSF